MEPVTKEITKMVRRKDKAGLPLLMVATMRDHLSTTKSAVLATITGQMVSHMQGTGERTKWTVKVNSNGKMAKATAANS